MVTSFYGEVVGVGYLALEHSLLFTIATSGFTACGIYIWYLYMDLKIMNFQNYCGPRNVETLNIYVYLLTFILYLYPISWLLELWSVIVRRPIQSDMNVSALGHYRVS